ncbi:MAG: hypothetical protein AAF108_02840 [Planctomycetota bacterium]
MSTSTKTIDLSKDAKIDARRAVTETYAYLAKRGKGKTYGMLRQAEQMLGHGAQLAIVDTVGVCWGLRCKPDGLPSDLPIYIAGGPHQDAPLADSEEAGGQLAKAMVEMGASFVIDVSSFSTAGMRRVVTGFCRAIYEMKVGNQKTTPVHVMIDEADEFAPQRATGEVARCLGAVDRMVRRGRARGIGVTIATQRSAVINKDVLTQTEILIAMGVTAPQDRKAIEDWASGHGDPKTTKEVVSSLAHLAQGEAWVLAPDHDIFVKTKIARRSTFDSSRTPEPNEKRKPVKLKQLDVKKLAKALTTEVSKKDEQGKSSSDTAKIKQLNDKVARLQAELANAKRQAAQARTFAFEETIKAIKDLAGTLKHPMPHPKPDKPAATKPVQTQAVGQEPGECSTSKGVQAIVNSIAWWESIGVEQPTVRQMAAMTPYSPKSSTMRNYRSCAKKGGLITTAGSGNMLTSAGRATADVPASSRTLEQLHAEILSRLDKGPRAMLAALLGGSRTRAEIEAETGYSMTSSTFRNYLSVLKTLGYIDVSGQHVKPTEVVMPPLLVLA